MPVPARPRLEGPAETHRLPSQAGTAPLGGAAGQLLSLQQAAGNAAVAGLIQRKVVRDRAGAASSVEFTVGDEVSLALATKAQQVAAGGVTDADLRLLRTEALGDDTIGDDERMFLAGLLDPANAQAVAKATIAAGTVFAFTRASIEAHLAHARDLDQAAKDPAIASERAQAASADTWGKYLTHQNAAIKAIFAQAVALVGPKWQSKTLDAFGFAIGKIPIDDVLEAMLNAASDDTPGDRAMAAAVYATAAAAGHPMAPMVRSGKIQIDQVASIAGGDFAHYRTTAGQGRKGDTVTVQTALDINDVAHRSAIIHELTHAAQDNRSTAPKVEFTDRERAELEAYRAGARYQLEQTAPLTMFARINAVRQIAALLNEITLLAMILESRADRRAFEPVVKEANAFWGRIPETQLLLAMQKPDTAIERVTLSAIGKAYGSRDASDRPIPGGNDLPIDALRGESVLDWIDRI